MIENRHLRVDYLLETAAAFSDPRDLLEDIVCAMSDQEFDGVYQYICRMRDIEPDEEKFEAMAVEEIPPAQKRAFDTDWQLPEHHG